MPNSTKKVEAKQQVAREKFIRELIQHLETQNYSKSLLQEVNDKCKFEKNYYLVLFDRGELEIANYIEQYHDDLMLKELAKYKNIKGIREKIAAALIQRIIEIVPKEAAIRQSSFFLMPQNALFGMENACRTCDVIWRFAGDKSTDFNYYTKRGLLLPVYLSAKTFYYADTSKDHEATKKYIKDALDNIVNIASLKHRTLDQLSIPKPEDIPILRMFL